MELKVNYKKEKKNLLLKFDCLTINLLVFIVLLSFLIENKNIISLELYFLVQKSKHDQSFS